MAKRYIPTGNEASSRRSVLGGLTTGAILGTAAYAAPQAAAATAPSDIVMMDAACLESVIHTRKASCVEIMSAYLDHIEKLNSKVNAIVALQGSLAIAGRGNAMPNWRAATIIRQDLAEMFCPSSWVIQRSLALVSAKSAFHALGLPSPCGHSAASRPGIARYPRQVVLGTFRIKGVSISATGKSPMMG
jgi:hypothetical protein